MSTGEKSLSLFLKIKKRQIKDQIEVIKSYYPKSFRFVAADLLLAISCFFYNPYRHCRKIGTVYGETPIKTLHRIVQFLPISSQDVWLELGSGRGKSCFWISLFVGCKTIGIEKSPLFSFFSKIIQKMLRIKNLSFLHQDQKEASFSKATIVYFYSTMENEETLQKITEKMKALPEGAHIVTISSFLPKVSYLELLGSFPVQFPWGKTEAFIHRKIG